MNPKPFLLRPTGKDYLWGGRRLNDEFAKNIPLVPLAETWECSTHPDGPSYAVGGEFDGRMLRDILREHPDFLGTHPKTQGELPILIKFIDANRDLSVQVHPDDAYASVHENGQQGKTELWYVLDAAKDAKLVYGLNRSVSAPQLKKAVETGELEKLLHHVPVQRDDLFFVRAGTIHAVGCGILLAEIQQSSNLTYRLYDYDRVDRDGKKRPLHIDKALDCADLTRSPEPRQPLRVLRYHPGMASELLCRSAYFEVHRLLVNTERRQIVKYRSDSTSFRVLLCIGGCGTLELPDQVLNLYKGDCIFFPADSEQTLLHGQMQLLDVRC